MAKIYGNTILLPAEAPLGVVTSPGTALLLPEGFTVPASKTATVSGTLDIATGGSLTSSGEISVAHVGFTDANSNAKLSLYNSGQVSGNVLNLQNSATVTINYARLGSFVCVTVAAIAGNSPGTGQYLRITSNLPTAVLPDLTLNSFTTIRDNTTQAVGKVQIESTGDITIFADAAGNNFQGALGTPKSAEAFSICYVIGSAAQQDSC